MIFKSETITPEMAYEMLKKNNVNRRLSPGRVNQYANDIANGQWQLNGEAIKFYDDDSLADGQHRLNAIIKANRPIVSCVIYGLPLSVSVQDRGRNRSVTDSMLLEGMNKSLTNSTIVGMAKLHYGLQRNLTNVSDSMVKLFIKNNENTLIDIINNTPKNIRKTKSVNVRCAPVLLACFYAVNSSECNIGLITDFLNVLHTGIPESLTQTSAIICRNDILSNAICITGSTSCRIKATRQIEKAIWDFKNQYPRKITYANWDEGIFSNHMNNKEV